VSSIQNKNDVSNTRMLSQSEKRNKRKNRRMMKKKETMMGSF